MAKSIEEIRAEIRESKLREIESQVDAELRSALDGEVARAEQRANDIRANLGQAEEEHRLAVEQRDRYAAEHAQQQPG